MKTYECHVYYDSKREELSAFVGPPSWIGPDCMVIGTFEFTRFSEPSPDGIRSWAIPRLKILGYAVPARQIRVRNFATHAYWGNAR